jgi:DNA invertase Pin-like site-specific DNA recombinase/uncharacterized protein YeeX (DUF496 family)
MARKSRKNIETAAVSTESRRVAYNAGAYERLSSDDKKKRGDSLETQRNIIESFIAASPDIRLCENYVDNNATGTNFERPGFQKMLADCENGKINCIIVKDLTRFGRNSIDAGYYLEKYLPSLNVRVIAVTDDYDSNDGDGGILLPLKNVIAESYALDISRKCRSVQRQNIKDGRFVGRMAPYGYVKDPKDCHKLLVDPEASGIVRQIFDWAAHGENAREISRRLNASDNLPPIRYKQARGIIVSKKDVEKSLWEERTIKLILSDSVYVGDMVQGKTRTVNHKEIDVPPDEWVCVPNTHEPIISREVFERARHRREQVAALDAAKRVSYGEYTHNAFKGKIFCAKCGKPMHRHRQNKDGVYWFRCQSQWKYGKDFCGVVAFREAELKTEIITLLHKHSEAILGKFITLDAPEVTDNTADKELREISLELDKSGRLLKSLYESMVGGLISQEEFVQMKADFEARIEVLQIRAAELRNTRRDEDVQKREYRDLADAVSSVLADSALTAEIIDRLIHKILVRPDKSVEILFRFGNEFAEVA